MTRVRGHILAPHRAFVKETFGEAGWKQVLAGMSPAQREVLDGLVVADSWYDRGVHRAELQALFRLFGAQVPDLGERLGVRSARLHEKFYLRGLIEAGGVDALVGRAASLYREYFSGAEMSVVERRDRGARFRVIDPDGFPEHCLTLPGFLAELARLAGQEPVHCSEVQCRFHGADACEIDLQWK